MKLLILTHSEVEQLLPMSECVAVMREALAALARGEADQPLRTIFKPDRVKGVMAMMPAFLSAGTSAATLTRGFLPSDSPMFGLKAICVFPGNAARGLDAHQGGVMLFDGTTGVPLALVNASAITAIRTAAVSALATSVLAREDAAELAIIGAGVQARTHLSAMACVRPIKRARIVGGRFESAQKFAKEMQPQFPFPVEPVETAEASVRDADLIVTATTAREPVVQRDWISPGAHINAIGTFSPNAREIDTATMAAATLFCDARESVLNEAGDYLLAAQEGAIGPDHIRAELGEVLIKTRPGRTSRDEITLFKSLGLAIEDLAAAAHVYRKAEAETAGTWVEF
ncbi:MAG: ornithine cyclodeaminase [Acidobacteria bacterium]|nr:MAG: ornithine cyclodeaminase [Acidobacteriota bacterium]